jgi:hypothetical protein
MLTWVREKAAVLFNRATIFVKKKGKRKEKLNTYIDVTVYKIY